MGLITHIGLPTGKHELKTGGIYKFSRNPMYASFIFLNTATFLFLPSILLLVIMLYGMIVHHFIILGEEKFLEGEFGDQYQKYKASYHGICRLDNFNAESRLIYLLEE